MDADTYLFIGGPKDGHRIRLPKLFHTVEQRDKPDVHVDVSCVRYHLLNSVPGHRIYVVEHMSEQQAMAALINRYPSPNPAP